MTPAARYNLQKGVPENKAFSHTNYSIESEIDAYILARTRSNRLILDQRAYNKTVEAAGKDIAAAAQKELDKAFKDFK